MIFAMPAISFVGCTTRRMAPTGSARSKFRRTQRATLRLDIDGKVVTEEATGNGPVDAIFNAIKTLVPHTAKLMLYQVHAVTEGTDAQAEVSVRLEEGGKEVSARGADADTLVASAKAYINALNKLSQKRQSVNPQTAAG